MIKQIQGTCGILDLYLGMSMALRNMFRPYYRVANPARSLTPIPDRRAVTSWLSHIVTSCGYEYSGARAAVAWTKSGAGAFCGGLLLLSFDGRRLPRPRGVARLQAPAPTMAEKKGPVAGECNCPNGGADVMARHECHCGGAGRGGNSPPEILQRGQNTRGRLLSCVIFGLALTSASHPTSNMSGS